MQQNSNSKTSAKPFLRRGSRKEPSALNRINKTPSPVPRTQSRVEDFNKVASISSTGSNNQSSYRDDRAVYEASYESDASFSATQEASSDLDLTTQSVINMNVPSPEKKRKQQTARIELDEFAELERQLEELDSLPNLSVEASRSSVSHVSVPNHLRSQHVHQQQHQFAHSTGRIESHRHSPWGF